MLFLSRKHNLLNRSFGSRIRIVNVVLKVGDRTIQAHKKLLSLKSLYFKAMFSGNFSESNQGEISLRDIDADSLKLLIDYMYTEKLKINSANVKDLLSTAVFLQITSAEELCSDFIKNVLDEENYIEYIMFAERNSIKDLLEFSLKTASSHFNEIVPKNDFLNLEVVELKQLTMRSKELGHAEDLIFSFVMRWINHCPETRSLFMEELLELMDPLLISPSVLNSSEVVETPNPVYTAWAARNSPAPSTKALDDYILISSMFPDTALWGINIFSEAKHREIECLPEKITSGSYVCNGYYIYHQGGWVDWNKSLTKSYVYHPTKRVWVPFVPLLQARSHHRNCVLNGKIYSVGGVGPDQRTLASVEFTDLYTGQRGLTDPLPYAKKYPGLCVHENSIYVAGGSDRDNNYQSIHRFDAREGVWQELTPAPYGEGANSCAVLGDDIFTIDLKVLQRYDIRANNWEQINYYEPEHRGHPIEIFALDNTLFGLFEDNVSRFIPDGRSWEIHRTLNHIALFFQVSTNLLFPNENEEAFNRKK